jgi:pimeloyl-ACP methyl ester carboxylesterase
MCSTALRQACEETQAPLWIETFVWSHGRRHILLDQADRGYARSQGQRLAELVAARRREYPEGRICLVGHSAGSRVVLAAVEELPPGVIDRVVLLSPSVPASYDLRAALHNLREGMDVHTSSRDTRELGLMVRLVNTFQGDLSPPAGIDGFEPVVFSPEDRRCYAKLHRFPWDPSLEESTGHDGSHYGCYQQHYLRQFVLPGLCGGPAVADRR